MKKPLFIVGTRPEIIKVSSLANNLDCNILFTGQHLDKEMSEFFFKLIDKAPLIRIEGKNYHQNNIGNFINDIKNKIKTLNPDSTIVQGDTNTTLYGAIASKSLGLKLNYIESGMRSGDVRQIEEFNRILVSGLADKNFCNHINNKDALINEGINSDKIVISGSTVFSVLESNCLLKRDNNSSEKYILLTLHRPENVDDKSKLKGLLKSINSLNIKIKFITHPRVSKSINNSFMKNFKNIQTLNPVEYFDFVDLIKNSLFVISDSGGLQEESAILGKPLLIPRDFTERPEMLGVFNLLVPTLENLTHEALKLLDGSSKIQKINTNSLLYGKTEVVEKILSNII